MAEAHKGMKFPEHAFHALAGHLVTQLKVQGLGGPDERDFLLGVLKSVWQDEIKPSTHDVVNSTDFVVFNAVGTPHWDTPTTPENIWVRLGGLDNVKRVRTRVGFLVSFLLCLFDVLCRFLSLASARPCTQRHMYASSFTLVDRRDRATA